MAPTERSMLPIRMTKLAPSEAMSSVAASPDVAEKFRQVKKVGDIQENTITRATTTISGSQVPRSIDEASLREAACLRAAGEAERDMRARALSLLRLRSAACGLSGRARSACRPAAPGSRRRCGPAA